MADKIILSGCSGGGKSSLINELKIRGELTVDEPGRRIVQQERANGGTALPWIDMADFARKAVALSLQDLSKIDESADRIFFDRGLIDALVAQEFANGQPMAIGHAQARTFYRTVFMVPPWPEIYRSDAERPHGFAEAVAEYARLMAAYPRWGYNVLVLPKLSIAARADLVLSLVKRR